MPADLFNERTVERLSKSKKIKISKTQKDNALRWVMMLDAGILDEEKPNYPNFRTYLLEGILGYSLEDLVFEKSVEFGYKNRVGESVVCFEVKGNKVKDLFARQHREKKEHETPVKQVWDYMGKGFRYGIATNYDDFILFDRYVGNEKYYHFNFRSIKSHPEKLKEFIAVFSKDRLVDEGFVEKIKKESEVEDREFTKEFYKLYHETRLMLIKEFEESSGDRQQAIHFAQIFLNRLMFVLFAEDTGNLKTRLLEELLLDALSTKMQIHEHSKTVCDTVIGLFQRLNTGSKTPIEIFGFNGGLFEKTIPANIYFKDLRRSAHFKGEHQLSKLKETKQSSLVESNILSRINKGVSPIISNILLMASFDFKTEVNVNILGHIFEQSLTDLEQLQEGETSKRKKEGIFYTPEYITDYICRNTIIPYLSKKESRTVEDLIKEYKGNVSELEKKLKELKILDPACGSGAFLIKSVDVLLEIHKAIIEEKDKSGKYTQTVEKGKGKGEYSGFGKYYDEDEARNIIKNNIYGVDINEESVEITKLSLFLKITREKKKLLNLSKNIKCGNSLIDDPEVDSKAFNWEKQFPEIFKTGKFDVVIGNPPYIRVRQLKKKGKNDIVDFLENTYYCAKHSWDVYLLFSEKAIDLLSDGGYSSFIIPVQTLHQPNCLSLRELIFKKTELKKVLNLSNIDVFRDAIVKNITYVLKKNTTDKDYPIQLISTNSEKNLEGKIVNISRSEIDKNTLSLKSEQYEFKNILKKIEGKSTWLGDICYVTFGLRSCSKEKGGGGKDRLISDLQKDSNHKPYLEGRQIKRYYKENSNKYLNYLPDEMYSPRQPELFENDKIISQSMLSKKRFVATYDSDKLYVEQSLVCIIKHGILTPPVDYGFSLKYILSHINSKLASFYFSNKIIDYSLGGGLIHATPGSQKKIPIVKISIENQEPFIKNTDLMISSKLKLNSQKDKFLRRILSSFAIDKTSKKLDSFWTLSFDDFQNEIKRLTKKKLSLKEQDEWEEYFNEYKQELTTLKQQVNDVDRELDQMIYNLYKLTPEEIKIVEDVIA